MFMKIFSERKILRSSKVWFYNAEFHYMESLKICLRDVDSTDNTHSTFKFTLPEAFKWLCLLTTTLSFCPSRAANAED